MLFVRCHRVFLCLFCAAADIANMVGYYVLFENANGDCSSQITDLIGHLVSVDLTTGALISDPEFCDLDKSTCPWSIQFWDGK